MRADAPVGGSTRSVCAGCDAAIWVSPSLLEASAWRVASDLAPLTMICFACVRQRDLSPHAVHGHKFGSWGRCECGVLRRLYLSDLGLS